MRIEELHLKNFRCFKELDIKFPASNLAVFIGLNGAGKTAILDAILLLLSNYQEPNKNFYISDDINIGSALTENKIIFSYNDDVKTWQSDSSYEEKLNIKETSSINTQKPINHLGSLFNTDLHEELATEYFFCAYYKTDKKENYIVENGLLKTTFTNFNNWFVEEENLENELKLTYKNFDFTNARLNVVREAMETFLSNIPEADFYNLRVRRIYTKDKKIGAYEEEIAKHSNHLTIQYKGKELKLSQLSDGQRLLIHLVGDIAYQLAQYISYTDYNPENDELFENYFRCCDEEEISNILKSSGIVLIDEIELHLHPQWQREVLPALQKTFLNIQFIVTTHSPQVLSRVHRDDIFILKDSEICQLSSNPIGRDSNDILEIMEVTKRPKEIQELSDKYFSLINKNLLDEAQEIRNQLQDKVDKKELDKDDPIFIRANAMITRKQLLRK